MTYCISDISAVELYRAHGRLLPRLLDGRRTAKLPPLALPHPAMLEEEMTRLGVLRAPYHVLAPYGGQTKGRGDIVIRQRRAALPRRGLVAVGRDVLSVSPELMFSQLGACSELDLVDMVELGYELCGTYVMDRSWDGYTPTGSCTTNRSRLLRMADHEAGQRGIRSVRQAAGLVVDGSHSPMETVLAMLFTLPRRLGGLGVPGASMNHHVLTAVGDRWIDVAFPSLRCGLEYKGRRPHGIERTQRDDRRQNEIAGSGMVTLNVWYEDLRDPRLFQQLVDSFAKVAGIRLRVRSDGFAAAQDRLRMRLLPHLELGNEIR